MNQLGIRVAKLATLRISMIEPAENWRECQWMIEQDGRLAPAYFSPNYKFFDQLLETVKNKTTVMNLVFKEFLQTSIHHWFLYYMQKGVTTLGSKIFVSQCPKISYGKTLSGKPCVLCFRKFLVAKKFMDERGGSIKIFRQKFFVSQCRKIS